MNVLSLTIDDRIDEDDEDDCVPLLRSPQNDTITVTQVKFFVDFNGDNGNVSVRVNSYAPGDGITPVYGREQSLYEWPPDEDDYLEYPEPIALYNTLKSKEFRLLFEAALKEEFECHFDHTTAQWVCAWRKGATPKLNKVVEALADVPTRVFEVIQAEDWYQDCYPPDPDCIDLNANATHEELSDLAKIIYEEALNDGYVIEGLYDFLEKWRDG